MSRVKRNVMMAVLAAGLVTIIFAGIATADVPELTFENSTEPLVMTIRPGSTRPTHVAELYLAYSEDFDSYRYPGFVETMLLRPAGKTLSQEQAYALPAYIDRVGDYGEFVTNHYRFLVYGVNEDGAKKAANAFVQAADTLAAEGRIPFQDEYAAIREEMDRYRERIPQVQEEIKALKEGAAEWWDKLSGLPSGLEERQANSKRIAETTDSIDRMSIQLAEYNGKLKATNDELIRLKNLRDTAGDISDEKREKVADAIETLEDWQVGCLQDMKVEQTRKEAMEKILTREKAWYKRYVRLPELEKDLRNHESWLERQKLRLREVDRELGRPDPRMWRARVFQNKAVIHPVISSQEQ